MRRRRRARRPTAAAPAPPPPPSRGSAAATATARLRRRPHRRTQPPPPPPPLPRRRRLRGRAAATAPGTTAAASAHRRAAVTAASAAAAHAGRQRAPPRRPRHSAAASGRAAATAAAARSSGTRAPPPARRTAPAAGRPPVGPASPAGSAGSPATATGRRAPHRRPDVPGSRPARQSALPPGGATAGPSPAADSHRSDPATPPRAGADPDRSRGGSLKGRAAWKISAARGRKAIRAAARSSPSPAGSSSSIPRGQSFIRHNEEDRFRFGARDIQTRQVGAETQTIVVRPDGSQIITYVGRDGQLLRRIRRDQQGREIIIIDNSYRDPRDAGGFYVDLPPPVIRIPYDRYIVDAEDASPDLIYDTMGHRRWSGSIGAIRSTRSATARRCAMLMPSIDLNTINFETGSWEIPPDQAAKLQAIADGLNRAIQRNPREVFLIEGHTDAVGNDIDNLSLSDRRAESAAELLTQQFGVPAENLTSQGYGSQYLKEQTDRAEPHQPARHHPPHHAAAQRRHGIAAAPAARHRAAAVDGEGIREMKMAGSDPGHFLSSLHAAQGDRRAFRRVAAGDAAQRIAASSATCANLRSHPYPLAERREGAHRLLADAPLQSWPTHVRVSALVAIELEDVANHPRPIASRSRRRDRAWRGYPRCRGCAWSAGRYGRPA